jgi:DNA-binding MarR family transcriptional regulator
MTNDLHPPDQKNALKSLFSEVGLLATRLRFAKGFWDQETSLAASDFNVLRVLSESGPLTVPQIARLRSTSRQNIQILVNRLEADGCVSLAENPAHKRSVLVHLTANGQRLFEGARSKETGFMTSLAGNVSEADIVAANSLLRQFRSRLETVEATPSPERRIRKNRTNAGSVPVRREPSPREAPADEPATGDLPYNLL